MSVPVPLRGALALPFRLVGIGRSKMNPNICTICERAFRQVKKSRHISAEVTILFADIRGYTRFSEGKDPVTVSDLVSAFQDHCARCIWAHDGIVNKQMGDGLMAIFNFPIKAERHAEAALEAALAIQRSAAPALARMAGAFDEGAAGGLGIGVGVHSGQVEIGEFSTGRSDFTAIGGTVNLAARLESQAAAGEIVVSPETAAAAPRLTAGAAMRAMTLKGIAEPVPARVLGG